MSCDACQYQDYGFPGCYVVLCGRRHIHTYIHNVLTTSYHGRTFILLVILQHRIPLGRSDTSEFGLRVDVSETLSLVSSGPKWGFSINCHYQQSACPVFAVVLALLFTAKTSKF